MSAKNRVWASLLVLGLVCTAACASVGSVPTTTPRKFTRVNVHVSGWAVEAVLIDRDGRRTGWTRSGDLREIKGCGFQSGWEDGIPSPRPDESDSAAVAEWEEAERQDSIYFASDPPPTWHSFEIGNNIYYHGKDGAKLVGLIDQGGCDLRLEPIYAGPVELSLRAEGSGFSARRDTTSAVVSPGKPQRWRLAWKLAGDSCVVRITRIEERGSARPPGK